MIWKARRDLRQSVKRTKKTKKKYQVQPSEQTPVAKRKLVKKVKPVLSEKVEPMIVNSSPKKKSFLMEKEGTSKKLRT